VGGSIKHPHQVVIVCRQTHAVLVREVLDDSGAELPLEVDFLGGFDLVVEKVLLKLKEKDPCWA